MSKKLEWKTVQRKVNDLVPLSFNPRKITSERQQKLMASLEKFNLAEIPVLNFDNTLIGGNQRYVALKLLGRGEEIIDCRFPNRQLSIFELKEYALTSNSHAGEWDFEILEDEFSDFDLEDFDITIPEYETEDGEKAPKVPKEVLDENKKWFVYIDCVNEREANKMYTELSKRGFDTKVVN